MVTTKLYSGVFKRENSCQSYVIPSEADDFSVVRDGYGHTGGKHGPRCSFSAGGAAGHQPTPESPRLSRNGKHQLSPYLFILVAFLPSFPIAS